MKIGAALCLLASPAMADLSCRLTDTICASDCTQTTVTFAIDPLQFVAPQNANDPPRRQVTNVTLDERRFSAQAIMMDGGIVGFHEDAGNIGSVLMIVQADGSARMIRQPENQTFIGQCSAS